LFSKLFFTSNVGPNYKDQLVEGVQGIISSYWFP